MLEMTVAAILEAVKGVEDDSDGWNEVVQRVMWDDILGLHFFLDDDKVKAEGGRLTERSLLTWVCTDTEVGYRVVHLDGEPVAIAVKLIRKSKDQWLFLSEEAQAKVYSFFHSLAKLPDDAKNAIVSLTDTIPINRSYHDNAKYSWDSGRPLADNMPKTSQETF